MMATSFYIVVRMTDQPTRVQVLIADTKSQSKHTPGSYIWSQRLPNLIQKAKNKSSVDFEKAGMIFKLVVRIHSTQTWIEYIADVSPIEVEVAKHVLASRFDTMGFDLVGLSQAETNLIKNKTLADDIEKFFDATLYKNISQYFNFAKAAEAAKHGSVEKLFDFEDVDVKPKVEKESIKVNDNYFYVDQFQASAFRSAALMLKNGISKVAKILMVGESGWGKTSLPKHFAQINNLAFMRMDCAKIRDPEEWFGFREAREGSTFFIKSDFVEALEKGNTVIVLDEINRLEPSVSNTLFPILDDTQQISIYNEKIKVGENVIFVATINIGFEYVGTFSLDEALLNRFDVFCPVGKIPTNEEVKVLSNRVGIAFASAVEIVTCAEAVRSLKLVHCSMRTTLSIARLAKALGGEVPSREIIRIAFQHVVIDRAESKIDVEKRPLVDAVNANFGVMTKSKVNLKVF